MNFNKLNLVGNQTLKARKEIEIVSNRQDWKYVEEPSLETMVDMLNNVLPFKLDYWSYKTGRNI